MKKLTLVILAAALAVSTAHGVTWSRTYGGEGAEVAYCVQQTEDYGYILCGEGTGKPKLIKTDSLGNLLWACSYGNGLSYWVEVTNDGSFIVTGTPDPDLLKVDEQGDSLWAYDYGIRSKCVDQTDDGGYILTGTYGYGEQLALIKTNYQGDTLWTKSYKMTNWDYTFAYFVRETNDAGYIVTGQVADSNGAFMQYNSTLLLVKTDSLGDALWVRIYDSIKGVGSCVRQTNDGGYIVTGSFGLLKTDSLGGFLWHKTYSFGEISTVQQTTDAGYILTGRKDYDLLLFKTDEWGDSLWARTYGEDGDEYGYCAHQTSDDGYITAGYTSRGAWLLKTDSLGLLAIAEEPVTESAKNWEVVSLLGRKITIRYSDRSQGFTARIYDSAGREVDKLCSSSSSGVLSWGENYAPGVYFIAVSDINTMSTAKVMLTH